MEKVKLTKAEKASRVKKKKLDKLYDKKPLIELIVAILSIPSLILLALLNIKSLTSSPDAKPTPTPVINGSYYAKPVTRPSTPVGSQAPCLKNLGPVTITSPNEGDTVTSNPAEVDISYDDVKYCGAVWSYSINGGQWSDYNNNSVALYNLPNGSVTFNLKVKSLASSETATITRNFIYAGQTSVVIPTNASNSAHQ
ncbi:MAG TPA: hypothetical protein VF810_04310 [Patescibacteria group bacterium]